ncbi:hypothetical protein FKM82_031061 [Ascaphus truei]
MRDPSIGGITPYRNQYHSNNTTCNIYMTDLYYNNATHITQYHVTQCSAVTPTRSGSPKVLRVRGTNNPWCPSQQSHPNVS